MITPPYTPPYPGTVPALALVVPDALPVSVIVLGVPISIGMLWHEHHAVDRAGAGWIITGRVPGTVLGALVVAAVSTTALQGVTGAVLTFAALAAVSVIVNAAM